MMYGVNGASSATTLFALQPKSSLFPVPPMGGGGKGRLGNTNTRMQIDAISTELESRGYTIIGGGQRNLAEEYFPPLNGKGKGGSFLDITAEHPYYGKIRINTYDTYKNGNITIREYNNAARIRQQIPKGSHLLLIPKIK
jgi:hypothetical protein